MELLPIGIGFVLGLVTMYQILKHDLIGNQPPLTPDNTDTGKEHET